MEEGGREVGEGGGIKKKEGTKSAGENRQKANDYPTPSFEVSSGQQSG